MDGRRCSSRHAPPLPSIRLSICASRYWPRLRSPERPVPQIARLPTWFQRRNPAQGLLRAHPPDRAVAVLRNQQRAIARNGYADRPSPDLAIVDDKASDEILVLAGWLAVLETDADDLVTGALRPVPGAVLGREGV